MPITATFPGVLEAERGADGSRTVRGVAVPWDVEGRVSNGETVIFHAGALDAAGRPPALRDHDRGRVVGRVADATDTGRQLDAAVRISSTPLGDETLTLAGDGALMFSVGAEPTQWDYDERGRMHVYAADWLELTLLPIGAYAGAAITDVTAAYPEGGTMPPATATDTPTEPVEPVEPVEPTEPDPDDDDQADDADATAEPAAPAPLMAGRSAAGRRRGAPGPFDHFTLADVSRIIAASRAGDVTAIGRRNRVLAAQVGHAGIEAALTDVVLVGADNVAVAHRPTYQAELVEIISWGTPLVDVLRQGDLERGDYPNKTFNTWTKTPEVALQTAEKEQIHSVPVSIGPSSVPVKTWAGGNDLSQQLLDFGSPSFVEDYIRAAGMDYALQIDTYAATGLLAIAIDVPTLADDSFVAMMGKLIGGLSPATTPPGGLFVATSYDIGVSLIGVTRDDGPAFWDGSVNFGRMTPEMSTNNGLVVFIDPNLPARTMLAGHRQGATWYDLPGTPFNLRAVNVGLLGLDIAVYGYGALGVQYPGAFTKTTQPLPAP